ncbi:tetratricopeptide repeat protein [Micromonospora zamorensis]|uniref:tetratricopeptide repeat protein n=1 Tax=Micromonospora zamorensis TaxID=709883 RepID=UPI0033F37596
MDLLADYRRATMFFETGDPSGAARLLEPIIDAEPGNTAVRQLLARAYFQSAQLNRAEEHLRELVDRDPSDHYSHHVLGRTLERLNRHNDALRYLRIAAAMYATNDDYRTALERVETRVGGTR